MLQKMILMIYMKKNFELERKQPIILWMIKNNSLRNFFLKVVRQFLLKSENLAENTKWLNSRITNCQSLPVKFFHFKLINQINA